MCIRDRATGFTDLDYKTSGLQNSDLILVAARPSMGKTAFVLNIAEYMAFKQNRSVAIFSLEMSRNQLMNRLFAMESRVNSQNLRTGNLKDDEWGKLIESAGIIGDSNLIIDDTPGISVRELRSKCRKYKLEHGLDIVMIDYLQLMTGGGRNTDSRQQEISDISRSLKALARELNVPVAVSYTHLYMAAAEGVPRCEKCGGIIKPDVVLYEEGLDQKTLEAAVSAISRAQVLIVGGTSLVVYPAAGLLRYFGGDRIVLINKGATSMDSQADLLIQEPIGQVLDQIAVR